MALFVLVCTDKPDALSLRMATREAHLAYVRENLARLKLAGPLSDEAGDMAGSLFIMEAEDIGQVRAFNAADPYTQAGLFQSVQVLPFRATVGGFAG